MSLAVHSRREVERRLERLRSDYGHFQTETITRLNDPAYFEHGRELVEEGHVGGAAAITRNEADELLLGYHTGEAVWGPPGGGHESGETLEETAVREVWEEASIDCRITDVYRATRVRYVHENDPQQRGYLLNVIFTAEYLAGTPDVSDDEEIETAAWFDRPPSPVVDVVELGSGLWAHADVAGQQDTE